MEDRRALLVHGARLRQQAYAFLAWAFLFPEAERLAAMSGVARGMVRHEDAWAHLAFFGPWQRFARAVARLDADGLLRLQLDYTRLFLVRPAAPPYESFYCDPQADISGVRAAAVARDYRLAGLAPSPSLKQAPDFVAMEIEFMSYLCGRESEGWEQGRQDEARRALERQQAFLQEHLGQWFPLFTQRVQGVAPEGLYRLGVEAGHAFIHHDTDLLPLLLTEASNGR